MAQETRKRKKQRTKRQHYVAQLYLRGFTNSTGRLFCFDKVSEKSNPTSTEAAAQESNFYEIPSGSFEGGVEVPVNTVENALSSIERMWAPLHADLIRSADAGIIPAPLKEKYSIFLVIQWMRTRAYRDLMYATTRLMMQSFIDELVDLNFPGESVKVEVGTKWLAAEHAQQLLDLDEIANRAVHLQLHLWVIGINTTEHLFYTSDQPVVRRARSGSRRRTAVREVDVTCPPWDNHLDVCILTPNEVRKSVQRADRSNTIFRGSVVEPHKFVRLNCAARTHSKKSQSDGQLDAPPG